MIAPMHVSMVVTDLDGTLLGPDKQISAADLATLEELGRCGVLRIVATGRSLFSALRVLGPRVPIDFLVHTSGAGIVTWPGQRSIHVRHMPGEVAGQLAERLVALRTDFMLHQAIPDNHHFFMHQSSSYNADFDRRVQLYARYATRLTLPLRGVSAMCQAVVIEPSEQPSRRDELGQALADFRVIRATSPLDHVSTWLEVFPLGVGKSLASERLRAEAPTRGGVCVAIGNDYNDLDLLDWADLPFVVENAPADLRARYTNVSSNAASGFSDAVRRALG
jgi:HAD superfamily hydrolase (TIGR01484 family)